MSLLTLRRGDTATYDIAITDDAGDPVDLSGMDVYFTAKRRYQDSDDDAVIAKSSDGNGIDVTNAAAGQVELTIDPADTAGLTDRALYWDVQVVAGTDVRTPLSGRLQLVPDVTAGTGS